ncbi:MAG: hypothetical protein INR66_00235 [Gordonia polyisoprenivorans]|nr:hypothetical protein [Gordonia polyisoprenivorans]
MTHLASTTGVLALHHANRVHSYSPHHSGYSSGSGSGHWIAHALATAFIWHSVGALFHHAHGLGLVLLIGAVVVVIGAVLARRRPTRRRL